MRLFLAIFALFASAAVAAPGTVIITIKQQYPVACPVITPAMVRNDDGTYTQPTINQATLQLCQQTREWQEEWTALPEQGGKFLRRIVKMDGAQK
jgi:hypothetical protein